MSSAKDRQEMVIHYQAGEERHEPNRADVTSVTVWLVATWGSSRT